MCTRLNLLRVASPSGSAIVALTPDPPDFTLALGMSILTPAIRDELDFAVETASLANIVGDIGC